MSYNNILLSRSARHCLLAFIVAMLFSASGFSQIKYYRQVPADNSINFGASSKFKVEVKACSGSFQEVYTYGVTPNDNQVTKKEHISMFGFNPAGGPATIKITLKNGTNLTSSNIELRNKTYKGVTTSFSGGAMFIEVCQPMKQLMVRMMGDKANPLMIHVDPYSDPAIPAGAKVKTFDGGTNGKVHEQTAQYDRYSVPSDVDVIVIEDGALFKGTIHTENRSKPLTIQGHGIIICREVAKPSTATKMQYNAMELNKGDGHKIYGVTLINGRHFAIRVSDEAHIQNVKLYGYRPNNDGIVAGKDSKIENCFFKCNDDHIKLYNPRMEVRNCVFYEQTNGAVFQFAWNSLTPGDNCIIENIEVVEWEASCGDPDLGQGGIARSFINHRESQSTGKVCANTTFNNIYIQGAVGRFICLNGLNQPITYKNLTVKNVTLEQVPKDKNWIYANKADNNTTSIEINFNNVRFGNRFIQASDFKTKGTMKFSYDESGSKYTGMMNPSEATDCSCDPNALPKDCNGVEGGSAFTDDCGDCVGGNTGKTACVVSTPSDIQDLVAVSTVCTETVLTWSDVSGAETYRVRRKAVGDVAFLNLTDVAANTETYTDESVTEGGVYIYAVRPVVAGVAVANSNQPEVTVPACSQGGDTPADITDLALTKISCTEVKLTWTDTNDEDQYRIRRRLSGETAYEILADVAADVETYNDLTAEAGKTYVYMVRPMQGGVAMALSNEADVTTPICVDPCVFTADIIATDADCSVGGSVAISLLNYSTRTAVKYKVGDQAYTANNSTADTYIASDLAEGPYNILAQWGNGECPDTEIGSATVGYSCTPVETTQTIELLAGWNMVSLYIQPIDSHTGSVFANASFVKNAGSFYAADGASDIPNLTRNRPEYLNSLTTLVAGEGYLVYNSKDETLTIQGQTPLSLTPVGLQLGWNLIGVPVDSPFDVSDLPAETLLVKDFDQYYGR